MSWTLLILCLLAPIGAIDVLYYHLYRFRLYSRPHSVAEQATHLVRQACFVLVVVILAGGVSSNEADVVVLFLLGLDLVNSGIDVWLEPRSRAQLGGLSRGEYLLHFLGTFGSGLATASYLAERSALPIPAASGAVGLQSAALIVGGSLLFAIEAGLFLCAVLTRWQRSSALAGSIVFEAPDAVVQPDNDWSAFACRPLEARVRMAGLT
jgi:hypothetical protein